MAAARQSLALPSARWVPHQQQEQQTTTTLQRFQEHQQQPILAFPLATARPATRVLAPPPISTHRMQPESMFGSVPGVNNARPSLSNAMPSLLSSPPQQQQQQAALQFEAREHQQLLHHGPPPPSTPNTGMDDLLDVFLCPNGNWNDIAGGRAPWELNAAQSGGNRFSVPEKQYTTMSLLPTGFTPNSHSRDLQDGQDGVDGGILYGNEDSNLVGSRLRGIQDNSPTLPGIALGVRGPSTLTRCPSVGSSGSEGSGGPHSPPPIAPTWRQPYNGGVPPLPMALATKSDSLIRGDSGEAHILGKRSREDDEVSMREAHSIRDGSPNIFSYGGAQIAPQISRSAVERAHQQGNGAASQGVQAASMYNQGLGSQPQSVTGGAPITGRPRVRARRGQATDPHSIAERLRRERIAERMKALQELVPNSNKTDKASMLDEIIDYVKFLQLQVKVLSMSRLGGAGAVAQPLVADLPSEGPNSFVNASMGRGNGVSGGNQDGLALTERQVAKLMEEDMGTAMQYLQSKGLCLMPISLATAISSTNSRSQGGNHGANDRQAQQQRAEVAAAASNSSLAGASSSPAAVDGEANNKSGNGAPKNKDGRELASEKSMGGSSSSKHSPKAKAPFKGKDDSSSQRRSQ